MLNRLWMAGAVAAPLLAAPNAAYAQGKTLRLAINAEAGHIPLYHIVIPWAMSSKVSVVHRADNIMLAKWAKVE